MTTDVTTETTPKQAMYNVQLVNAGGIRRLRKDKEVKAKERTLDKARAAIGYGKIDFELHVTCGSFRRFYTVYVKIGDHYQDQTGTTPVPSKGAFCVFQQDAVFTDGLLSYAKSLDELINQLRYSGGGEEHTPPPPQSWQPAMVLQYPAQTMYDRPLTIGQARWLPAYERWEFWPDDPSKQLRADRPRSAHEEIIFAPQSDQCLYMSDYVFALDAPMVAKYVEAHQHKDEHHERMRACEQQIRDMKSTFRPLRPIYAEIYPAPATAEE